MFGFFKEKIKSAISKITKKVEEEVPAETKIEDRPVIEKKSSRKEKRRS